MSPIDRNRTRMLVTAVEFALFSQESGFIRQAHKPQWGFGQSSAVLLRHLACVSPPFPLQ